MKDLYDALISLVPPILVGGIFWIIMRAILGADRKERDVYNKIEAEERAKLLAAKGKAIGK